MAVAAYPPIGLPLETELSYTPPRASTSTPNATASTSTASTTRIRATDLIGDLIGRLRASSRREHELMNKLRSSIIQILDSYPNLTRPVSQAS
jgi:hypothetical protein